jgi:hypothetical protein
MFSKGPKNTSQYFWTEHAKYKMQYYGLSAQRILGVIRNPKRKEEGIVKNTIAVMSPVSPKIVNGKTIWKQETWVMLQKKKEARSKNKAVKIISAWRYPGVSPKRNPIPEEIISEIKNMV